MDLSNRTSLDLPRISTPVVSLLTLKLSILLDLITRLPFGTTRDRSRLNHPIPLILMLLANSELAKTLRTTITSLLDGMDLLKFGLFSVNALPLSKLMMDQSML
jgi:hypothetical protein